GEELARLGSGSALGLVAAEHGGRLGCQTDVAHHRNARADQRPHPRQRRAAALELHGVRIRLLDEADRVLEGILVADLERAKRHIADEQRPPDAAAGRRVRRGAGGRRAAPPSRVAGRAGPRPSPVRAAATPTSPGPPPACEAPGAGVASSAVPITSLGPPAFIAEKPPLGPPLSI